LSLDVTSTALHFEVSGRPHHCVPSEFYLWQDSPGGDWWVQGYGETARVWILDVAGKRVTFLAHSYPGSGENAKAEFQKILDSIVFDATSTPPSASPAAS